MTYRYHTLDVFTGRIFGGNPLAVFPAADGLSDAQMQAVARELNLSETVFVFPPDDPAHTRRVRIFTPARELPFAGHPTVGTAVLLASLGAAEPPAGGTGESRMVLEEGVGPVPVTVAFREGQPVSAQLTAAQPPEHRPAPAGRAELAALLSLAEDEVLDAPLSPAASSAGVPFLFVPVRDRAALGRARLDPARWEALLSGAWARSVFVFTADAELPGSHLRGRMFAPEMGIPEDPATGSAAAALGGYLAAQERPADGTFHRVVEQGFEMGRPSLLHVEVDVAGGEVRAVRVGGAAVQVGWGEMEIPPV
jgi:trans-2,3-dihydro-3-hydroxyanthranilate isomerase